VSEKAGQARKNANGMSTMDTLVHFGMEELKRSGSIDFNLENVLRESGLVGLFKFRSLRKQLPNQNPIKSVAIENKHQNSSKTDELIKLSRLKTEGMISESEFESLKKEIIG
jgi:hypothetical protein